MVIRYYLFQLQTILQTMVNKYKNHNEKSRIELFSKTQQEKYMQAL